MFKAITSRVDMNNISPSVKRGRVGVVDGAADGGNIVVVDYQLQPDSKIINQNLIFEKQINRTINFEMCYRSNYLWSL